MIKLVVINNENDVDNVLNHYRAIMHKNSMTGSDVTVEFPEHRFYTSKAVLNWIINDGDMLNKLGRTIITGNEHVLDGIRWLIANGVIKNNDVHIDFIKNVNNDGSLNDHTGGFFIIVNK